MTDSKFMCKTKTVWQQCNVSFKSSLFEKKISKVCVYDTCYTRFDGLKRDLKTGVHIA